MRYLLFLIAAALFAFGLAVALTAPAGGPAPQWVHVLSAVPFLVGGLLVGRFGST